MQKFSGSAPRLKSSHDLAVLCITMGGAEQPAALTHGTVAVAMVPLFASQINQIEYVCFLNITFPFF
jgi:hypothetical protein